MGAEGGGEKSSLLERAAARRSGAAGSGGGGEGGGGGPVRRSKRLRRSNLKPVLMILLYIVSSAGNALTFKRMTDVYADSEFFASQWNVLLYTAMALFVVASKALKEPGFLRTQRECFSWFQIVIMACLDAVSSVCSTIGGANTAGAVQNLINQTLIPMTLAMSAACLGRRYSARQVCGAGIILGGACWAVTSAGGKGDNSTTWAGALVFGVGILPSAYSNVYKEMVFNLSAKARRADVYYLTTVISGLQVFLGFLMVPLLPLPAFGGTPLGDLGPQLERGFRCFAPTGSWARDSSPLREALFGDDDAYAKYVFPKKPETHDLCDEGFVAMVAYVVVNFGYNILQLLICQHSSAATLVMATALALPATSLMFSSPALVGRDAMPYGARDLAGLALVGAGHGRFDVASTWVFRTHSVARKGSIGSRTPRAMSTRPKMSHIESKPIEIRGFKMSHPFPAQALVVLGFVVYSAYNPDEDGVMPPQAAAGSAMYVRRPRADSDPPTPAVLHSPAPGRANLVGVPRRARATSFDTRHHVSSPGDLITVELNRPQRPAAADGDVDLC